MKAVPPPRARMRRPIGLGATDDGIWSIYFNTVLLAKLDQRDHIILGATPDVLPMLPDNLLPIIPVAQFARGTLPLRSQR